MKRAHICLIVMLAAPLAATAQRTIGPDSAGYKATDVTSYSFIDIAQTGARVLSGTDDDTVRDEHRVHVPLLQPGLHQRLRKL
jgi:hypothetical protein